MVGAEFVELDAGTGVVHIAPAFGETDFDLLRREQETNPELPLLCAVRPDGGFDPEIAPSEYAGRWVKDCDPRSDPRTPRARPRLPCGTNSARVPVLRAVGSRIP